MSKENPFPAGGFVVLAIGAALLFLPRVIEHTDSSCHAVMSQVVAQVMAQIPETETAALMAKAPADLTPDAARDYVQVRLRQAATTQLAPKLRLDDETWYQCSILYWVNWLNPSPHP